MRFPTFTVKGLMIVVAVCSLDFFLISKYAHGFAGIFLPLLGLNLGLILILRKERTKRRFWVGFEAVGLVLLGLYFGEAHYGVNPFSLWPWTCYHFLFNQLSPAAQDAAIPWLHRVLETYPDDTHVQMLIWGVIRYESTIGLPLVLLATIGGWVWKLVGPKAAVVGWVKTPLFLGPPAETQSVVD